MALKLEKTGRHLRNHALTQGAHERTRASQALACVYLNDSSATLARMLLATLGGSTQDPSAANGNNADEALAGAAQAANLAIKTVDEVTPSMQSYADETEIVSSAS